MKKTPSKPPYPFWFYQILHGVLQETDDTDLAISILSILADHFDLVMPSRADLERVRRKIGETFTVVFSVKPPLIRGTKHTIKKRKPKAAKP